MKIATLGLGTIDINKFDFDGSFSPEMNRPNFGMFGSTLIKTKYGYTTDWFEYICKIQYDIDRYETGFLYELKENTKIYTMDSEEDYVNLLTSRYRKVTKLYKDKQLLSVDWDLVAKDFDAFHLTKEGYLNLRSLSPVFYMGDRICVSDFSSYDCETWILFNLNCIDENTIETICLNNG